MGCYRIEILTQLEGIPEHFKQSNGNIILDLGEDDSLTFSEELEEVSEFNELKIDGILNITVPQSPLNKIVLDTFFCPSVVDQVFEPLKIRLWKGTYLAKQRWIYPQRKNDSDCTYELKAVYRKDHWVIAANECLLCDVELDNPEHEFTYANLFADRKDTWNNGDKIYQFVPYWLGNTLTPDQFILEDFRPAWSLLGLTNQLGKKIGWCINAPILETEMFRKVWLYLADENYCYNTDNLDAKKFSACYPEGANPTTQTWGNLAGFTDESFGNGNFIDDECFTDSGTFDFKVKGVFNVSTQLLSSQDVTLKMVKKFPDGSIKVIGEQVQNVGSFFSGFSNDFVFFDLTVRDVSLINNCKVCLVIDTDGSYTNDLEVVSLCFWNCPISTFYAEGDVIDMANTLSCKYSFADLLKGILHLFNGKIETDWNTKTINIFPPYTVDVGGETIEGFFDNQDPVDITDKILCLTGSASTPQYEKERFCTVGFKKSKDPYIKDSPLYSDSQPFDRTTDIGGDYQNKTKEDRNPFFEATLLSEHPDISVSPSNSSPLHLLNLTDNDNGTISCNICPRIFFLDNSIQMFNGEQVALSVNDSADFFPTGYQDLSEENFTTFNNDNYTMSYDVKDENFFNKFYKKWIFGQLGTNTYGFDLIFKCCNDYFELTFRRALKFTYEGKYFRLNLLKKTFDACGGLGNVIGNPDRKVLNNCDDDLGDPIGGGGDDPICDNNPLIECELNGTCYDLSIGGTNNSPISNTIWEYQLINPNDPWVVIPNTTSLTAQICDLPRDFRVRVQVIYSDNCPNLYAPVVTKDPCGNDPVIVWDCYENTLGQTCFKASLGGTYLSVVDTLTFDLTIGTNPSIPYVLGSEYCFALGDGEEIEVCINGIITWVGGCEDSIIEDECKTFPPNVIDCSLTDALPECIEQDGCYVFDYNGVVVGEVAFEMFKITCKGEVTYWKFGDPVFCCDEEFTVSLVLVFCDGCPVYCSDPIICAPTPCPSGSIAPMCGADCKLKFTISGYEDYMWSLDGNPYTSDDIIQLTETGVYTLTGVLDGCPTITEIFPFTMPKSGKGGKTNITK